SKFQATCSKLPALSAKTRCLHVETAPPQCLPAEQLGGKQDVLKYGRGTILCETDGKHDWIQTGEMIKVGLTWRLVDAPFAGDGSAETLAAAQVDPALQGLLDQLRDLDAKAPKGSETPGANAELVSYNLRRATLLEQIVSKVKPEEREQWIRQVA